jgi:hypothetical protein
MAKTLIFEVVFILNWAYKRAAFRVNNLIVNIFRLYNSYCNKQMNTLKIIKCHYKYVQIILINLNIKRHHQSIQSGISNILLDLTIKA